MRTAPATQNNQADDQVDQHTADRARFPLQGAIDPPSPLELYAGVPLPGHTPSVPAIARAYAHFRTHYRPDDPEHRLILDGASRAFTALQERAWCVLDDGTMEIAGSHGDTTYVVSDADCRQKGRTRTDKRTGRTEPALCPSFLFSQRRHGGACYHVIARELLRLAQVIEANEPSAEPAVAEPYLPFVSLPGRLLGLAFGIARLPEQTVTLDLAAATLTITVGDHAPLHTTRLTCSEGQGHAQVQLSADAFAELWLPFRPVATSLDLVTLFVDLTDGLVLLSSDDFAAQAQGVLR